MPGETPKTIVDQSKTIETHENPSNNEKKELLNLSTNVETWVLEQEVMLNQVRSLLKEYQSLKKWIRTSEWNGPTKKQLEHRLNENIENLKNIRKDLWWSKEALKDENKPIKIKDKTHIYSDLTTYKWRIGELQYYFSHYEQVRQIIVLWWRTSDIHAIIDSIQDAKKSRHYEKQDNKYQQRMNEILHDPAITSLRNNDMERYEEYLEKVVNWEVEPSAHPFYNAHCQSLNMIKSINPSLYQILVPSRKRTQRNAPVVIPATWVILEWRPATGTVRTCTNQPESFPARIGKAVWELMSNFSGVEKDPRKRRAWEQAWSVAAIAWSIFMWYKVIKNLFSSKKDNPKKRWKAAARWAWLLALTNSDRIGRSLINWVQDISWWHPAEKIQASKEIFQTYWFTNAEAQKMAVMHVWAPIATLSALHFVPIYELNAQRIIEYQNNQFKFNYDNYKQYIDTYDAWTDEQKKTVLAAWEALRNNNSLDDWLNALGVHSQSDLDKIANWDQNKTLADEESVHQRYLECTKWVTSGVNAELYQRWLKAKDVESAKKIIKEYEQKPWEDIDKLIEKRSTEWLLEVATDSPMVRILSDLWIKIEDPTEIKKTEERLKGIQEWMKYFAPWVQPYKPYSIEWNKLMFTNVNWEKITIPDGVEEKDKKFPPNLQNRTLNDYPAVILNNQEKFLEFMNDPNNHMRWKEVSSRSA